MWLKEEFSPRVFFPDAQNKKFVVNDDVGFLITSLKVEGSNEARNVGDGFSGIVGGNTPSTSKGSLGCSSFNRLPNTNQHCPKPIVNAKRSSQTSINVKVVQAKLSFAENNKPEFEVNNQTFIEVSEETANINYIFGAVQRKWGDCYTVVTNEIDDCSGTQG